MARSEEEKLVQVPAKVVLGNKEYEIKPLPIQYASPWRKKFIALMSEVSTLAKVTSEDPKEFLGALANILTEKPEQLVDLFFEYAKDLNRKEIESTASSIEILNAIEEVIKFESPFLGAAIRMTRAMQRNLV